MSVTSHCVRGGVFIDQLEQAVFRGGRFEPLLPPIGVELESGGEARQADHDKDPQQEQSQRIEQILRSAQAAQLKRRSKPAQRLADRASRQDDRRERHQQGLVRPHRRFPPQQQEAARHPGCRVQCQPPAGAQGEGKTQQRQSQNPPGAAELVLQRVGAHLLKEPVFEGSQVRRNELREVCRANRNEQNACHDERKNRRPGGCREQRWEQRFEPPAVLRAGGQTLQRRCPRQRPAPGFR